ncbi:hypothetical protein YTPLAS18_33360 [Nitrospira sp.]|nr:hypothetical protein YTPLAS18_33360 [Nitrospira sp.]
MNNCRLCSELESQTSVWNKPLFESPNFVALPSLGSLVEGWLLLVPKRHFISFGAIPESFLPEILEIKQFLFNLLVQHYGTAAAFEHGPYMASRSVGCGVDHAHLHLVPIRFNLAQAVLPYLPSDANWEVADLTHCRIAHATGEDYLYLEQPIGSGRITTHHDFGSQLFRKAIAARLGMENQYNWREHHQLPTVLTTIKRLQTLSTFQASDQENVVAA